MSIEITLPKPSMSMKLGNFRRNYIKLKEKGGVYFLYNVDDELIYVGKSKNLYSRINQHITGHGKSINFSHLIYRIDVVFESDELYRELYETYAINTLKPIYNISKVYKAKQTEDQYKIQTRLDELISEREYLRYEIYEMVGALGDPIVYDYDEDLTTEQSDAWAELSHMRRQYRIINEKIKSLRKEFSLK